MKRCPFLFTIKQRDGLSLVEVIVVLVILAILAALLVPTFVKYIDYSQKKICETNRLTLIRYYKTSLLLEPNVSLSEYIVTNLDNMGCPIKGTYTVHEESIHCSKHGSLGSADAPPATDSSSDTPTPTTSSVTLNTPTPTPTPAPTDDYRIIPGTGVIVNSEFPNVSEFDTYEYDYLYKGQTLYYDGKYYIAITTVYITKSKGVTPDDYVYNNNGLVLITGRIIEWDGSSETNFHNIYKDDKLPKKGDICYDKVGDEWGYYVYSIYVPGQTHIYPPSYSVTNWVKLCSTYPFD